MATGTRTPRKAQGTLVLMAIERYGRATAGLTRAVMTMPVSDENIVKARKEVADSLLAARNLVGELVAEV